MCTNARGYILGTGCFLPPSPPSPPSSSSHPSLHSPPLPPSPPEDVLSLLQLVGVAYCSLQHYKLVEAVTQFRSLPQHHYHTPWVLTNTAHAFMAGEKFKEVTADLSVCVFQCSSPCTQAAQLFEQVHRMDPHRQEGMLQATVFLTVLPPPPPPSAGMELYAAVLWHLQKETELSVLVEELQSSNRLTPQVLQSHCTTVTTSSPSSSSSLLLPHLLLPPHPHPSSVPVCNGLPHEPVQGQ